jgi:hypothetical protein
MGAVEPSKWYQWYSEASRNKTRSSSRNKTRSSLRNYSSNGDLIYLAPKAVRNKGEMFNCNDSKLPFCNKIYVKIEKFTISCK